MRILFIGCVKSSAYFLSKLILHKYVPVGVVTKSSSKFNSDFVDLTPMCKDADIPFIQVSDVNSMDSIRFIEQCGPDIIYCFGWSQLIKQPVLGIPPKGIVGFHPAMLPCNRGRHPIIWALALGLLETASTFFMMDEQADTGAIISQEPIPILYEDDAAALYDRILQVAGKQLLAFTKEFECGAVQMCAQSGGGNTWRKRSVLDGQIDWRMSGRAIYNLVRALTKPYPGAHFLKNGNMIKVWRVEEYEINGIENIEYGKVLSVNSPTDFIVKAYDEAIHVMECDPVVLEEGEYLI